MNDMVALRKESVDRNSALPVLERKITRSLSARRAWIEIIRRLEPMLLYAVALRKESVDRNYWGDKSPDCDCKSLSARRAWIEMLNFIPFVNS